MATVAHVPLMQVQRDLMDTERGFQRFREYLDTMIGKGSGDEPIELPLSAFNPMSSRLLKNSPFSSRF